MLACLALRRERLRVTVEVEALCVTLDSMSLVLASVSLTCWLRLLAVRLWLVIPRERAAFFARLWASRDASEEAIEFNLLV